MNQYYKREHGEWIPINWDDIKKGDFCKRDDELIGWKAKEDAKGKTKIYLEGYYFDPDKFKPKFPLAA